MIVLKQGVSPNGYPIYQKQNIQQQAVVDKKPFETEQILKTLNEIVAYVRNNFMVVSRKNIGTAEKPEYIETVRCLEQDEPIFSHMVLRDKMNLEDGIKIEDRKAEDLILELPFDAFIQDENIKNLLNHIANFRKRIESTFKQKSDSEAIAITASDKTLVQNSEFNNFLTCFSQAAKEFHASRQPDGSESKILMKGDFFNNVSSRILNLKTFVEAYL